MCLGQSGRGSACSHTTLAADGSLPVRSLPTARVCPVSHRPWRWLPPVRGLSAPCLAPQPRLPVLHSVSSLCSCCCVCLEEGSASSPSANLSSTLEAPSWRSSATPSVDALGCLPISLPTSHRARLPARPVERWLVCVSPPTPVLQAILQPQRPAQCLARETTHKRVFWNCSRVFYMLTSFGSWESNVLRYRPGYKGLI